MLKRIWDGWQELLNKYHTEFQEVETDFIKW
jgi:hypothetical protein